MLGKCLVGFIPESSGLLHWMQKSGTSLQDASQHFHLEKLLVIEHCRKIRIYRAINYKVGIQCLEMLYLKSQLELISLTFSSQ